MKQYLDLVQHVMDNGCQKEIEPEQVQKCFRLSNAFDLSEGFPMVTTKKLHFKSIVYELLWFLKVIQILNTFKRMV
jgi:thymidylate synthase